MRILVSGASGLLGQRVSAMLGARGDTVVALSRRAAPGAIAWDPEAKRLDRTLLAGFDAVVHLAGENIAAARWSAAQKTKILASRVDGTKLLAEAVAELPARPSVFVQASAIGYYGSRGDEILDEASAPGHDFLAGVVKEWEAAAEPARARGIRTVALRFGVILAKDGGALKKMLLPFKLGLGGKIGAGAQWMSWIHLEDAARAVLFAIDTKSMSGPAVATSPCPVTNQGFTKALGRALGRPTIFPMPAFAAKLAFGEMAEALLLASQRTEPKRLVAAGFQFFHPNLDDALQDLLN